MDEPQMRESKTHPFEKFRDAMKKLVAVPKSELDEKLKQHDAKKPEWRAGRKPTRRKADL